MGKKWEHLENLKEFVYVTDMETNELVYMNRHARSVFHLSSHEEYAGKVCYKLFQGEEQPCTFCTNHKLKSGEFVEWTYENTFLKKKFILKDTMIEEDGKKYRMELAIDAESDLNRMTHFDAHIDLQISECLKNVLSLTTASEGLEYLVKYVGNNFKCDRAYIFELQKEHVVDNTYEWCAKDVVPQKEVLQAVPKEIIQWWFDLFENGEVVSIEDLELIRYLKPQTYGILKSQNIHSVIVAPVFDGEEIIGFIGVDNPGKKFWNSIVSTLKVLGYFIGVLIRRRDMLDRLHELSYRDELTGAKNRHALFEEYKDCSGHETMGVIYCDVSGLKKINDTLGHEAGDDMIRDCYHTLYQSLKMENIFRMGGDEFVAVLPDLSLEMFQTKVEKLKDDISRAKHHIAVGGTWESGEAINIEKMITEADHKMYEDKKVFYNIISQDHVQEEGTATSSFHEYLKTNYFNAEMMIQSLALQKATQFIFMGDMQTNTFYISDSMRDTFGFQSNIVQNLLQRWEERIVSPEHCEMYKRDISQMLQEKRNIHDLRYKVRDVYGNVKWIHCSGRLEWDKERKLPCFFSGCVSTQDDSFIVDPITNFRREQSALYALSDLKEKTKILVFSLNQLSEINRNIGRYKTNLLIQNISKELLVRFGENAEFFRLEGMRFLVILKENSEDVGYFVSVIRKIVEQEFQNIKSMISNVCSIGVIEYPNGTDTPQELIENLETLISCAKNHPEKPYMHYLHMDVEELKEAAHMSVVLVQDVMEGMRNFHTVVQPIVNAVSGKVVGGEMLLRWRYQGKEISPDVFVPLLEKGNVIHLVGRWVIKQAILHCGQICQMYPDFFFSVNISHQQIQDDMLFPFVEETLKQYGVKGENLFFEFTETHFDENVERLKNFIHKCGKLHIRLALDDFGTAYSSLKLLLSYPVELVKLDRSMLVEMAESEEKQNFISSIVYACHRFEKKVCMEGVETMEQSKTIADAGCDLIQGYYYFKPMDVWAIYQLDLEKTGKA